MRSSIKFASVHKIGLALLALTISLSAYSGTRDGGGGVAVRCADQHGSSLQLLDLYEGKARGLTFGMSPATDLEIADLTADVLATHYWNPWTVPLPQYKDSLKSSFILGIITGKGFHNYQTNKFVSISYVDSVPLSNDYGNYYIRPNCHLEQVAYFDDVQSTIMIDKKLWNELDGLDKAALVIHEIGYFEFRYIGLEYAGTGVQGVISSERSRQFTSSLLSTQGLMPKIFGVDPHYFMSCYGDNPDGQKDTAFFAYDSDQGEVTLVVSDNNGFFSPYSERVKIPGISTNDLLSQAPSSFHQKQRVSLVGEIDAPTFNLEITKVSNSGPTVLITRMFGNYELPIGEAQTMNCNFNHPANP